MGGIDMAIKSMEAKDYLAFQGEFSCNSCDGLNIVIGSRKAARDSIYVSASKSI
jgi:hypothetical protein